jgi:sugar/nucleoside kinase (ribokinase family)
MSVDFVAVGEAGIDTFLMLNADQADVLCRRNPATCELSLPYGEKVPVETQITCLGGNAANAAVAAARFGVASALLAVRGDDATGERVAALLAQEGVQDNVMVSPGSATPSSTIICYERERTILSYHPPRGTSDVLLPEAKWIYFTSLKSDSSQLETVVRNLVVQTTSVKLAFQPGSYHVRQGAAALEWALKSAALVVMNNEEACIFLGMPRTTAPAVLLRQLHEHGAEMAVITNGGQGSLAYVDGQLLHQPVVREAPRVEVTGAGDAFASTTALALADGQTPETALLWAQINAASVIGVVGAQQGLLSKDELVSRAVLHENLRATPISETFTW